MDFVAKWSLLSLWWDVFEFYSCAGVKTLSPRGVAVVCSAFSLWLLLRHVTASTSPRNTEGVHSARSSKAKPKHGNTRIQPSRERLRLVDILGLDESNTIQLFLHVSEAFYKHSLVQNNNSYIPERFACASSSVNGFVALCYLVLTITLNGGYFYYPVYLRGRRLREGALLI